MRSDDNTSQARWRACDESSSGWPLIAAAAACMVSLTRPPAGSRPSAARSPRVIQTGRAPRLRDEG